MKVLMITSDHLMIDRRILQQANSLTKHGATVELLAGFECAQSEDYEWNDIRICRFVYDWSDTRVDRLLAPLKLKPGIWRERLWAAVRRATVRTTGLTSFEHFVLRQVLEREFDVLHVHDFLLLSVAVEAKRRTHKPLVYDAHELYHAQSQLPRKIQRLYKDKESRLIRHADLAFTVNPYIAEIMERDYRCRRPEVLLNAASPLCSGKQEQSELRQRLGLAPHERILLYQGWMSPERGIDKLVQMARFFPPHIRLVLVGYGAHMEDLVRQSAEQGTDDGRVVFLGRVEPEDLSPLTASADLGIIPYHAVDLNNTYCSPNKLFEFIVAGVPFISNDLPYLRSVIDTYGCGVTANLQNPEVGARKIIEVFDDAHRLADLKEAAGRAAMTLNWDVEEQKFLRCYQQMLSRNGLSVWVDGGLTRTQRELSEAALDA